MRYKPSVLLIMRSIKSESSFSTFFAELDIFDLFCFLDLPLSLKKYNDKMHSATQNSI